MELNGMCLIWGWQSTNCFLFELLPAWLGTAVIETIMFHSSLAIIYLESSFTAVPFSLLKSLPWSLSCRQALHPSSTPRARPVQAEGCPAFGWTCPRGFGVFSPRALISLWLRARGSPSSQGTTYFPSIPQIYDGFGTILWTGQYSAAPGAEHFGWPGQSAEWRSTRGRSFCCLWLSFLLCPLLEHYTEVGCGCHSRISAGNMQGITNRFPLSWRYPFMSNF